MRWRNTPSRYGFVATALHWIIVAGVIGQYLLAEAAEGTDTDAQNAMYLHYSIGMTLLGLAVLRLFWRLAELPPKQPLSMSAAEAQAARLVHGLFYILLFAIPITGWALATADGQSFSYFGVLEIPQVRIGAQLPVKGGTLSEHQLEQAHAILFDILLVLALLHVLAALKHHLIDHDGVLRSMLPWRR